MAEGLVCIIVASVVAAKPVLPSGSLAATLTDVKNISSVVTPTFSDVIFGVVGVLCSNAASCRLRLQTKFPKASAKKMKVTVHTTTERCSLDDPWSDCCHKAMDRLQQSLTTLKVNDHGNYLTELSKKLKGAKCQLYCEAVYCTLVQCDQWTKCNVQVTATSSSPASDVTASSDVTLITDVTVTGDVNDGGTSTQPTGGNTATNTGGDGPGTRTLVILVVTCVIAFLAGIGGACLFIFLRRRLRHGSQSKAADPGTRDGKGRELNAVAARRTLANTGPAQTKMDTHTHNNNNNTNNNNNQNEYTFSLNENEYSCISDEKLSQADDTTKPQNTPHASHLQDRKLPTAPAMPDRAHPLAEMASRDHSQEGETTPDGGGAETRGREGMLRAASVAEDCYSPLNLTGGQPEESEYTALDVAEAVKKKDGRKTHDYLEVVADYDLSKPIRE
ncbi:hypothetical protein ACOMHN_054931 [Nucella lapillus]